MGSYFRSKITCWEDPAGHAQLTKPHVEEAPAGHVQPGSQVPQPTLSRLSSQLETLTMFKPAQPTKPQCGYHMSKSIHITRRQEHEGYGS